MFKIAARLGLTVDHPAIVSLNLLKNIDYPAGFPKNHVANCQFLIARLAMIAAEITKAQAEEWFSLIVAATKTGKMRPEEIEIRCATFGFAVEGKPAFLFDETLQRQVLLEFDWLPTPAEVWSLVKSEFEEFESAKMSLNRLTGRSAFGPLPTRAEVAALGWNVEPKSAVLRLAAQASAVLRLADQA